jgi:uncharacterized protein YecE (DUF72 family)
MLEFYGERLNAVEINNTFYRMPSRKVLADWASKVPSDFSFVLKASRYVSPRSSTWTVLREPSRCTFSPMRSAVNPHHDRSAPDSDSGRPPRNP